MTEFNLSEKIEDWHFDGGCYEDLIDAEDVKEFIRLLKQEMHLTIDNAKVINKLAGDKLI